ncbi:TetR/AcrR family transcriptional regulator [Leifsonia virtsii]|uniref:TetR/AcrR family transcriptional regulator n=1 Tax=Leifsonia virtsii TaxID=3035915 RepID=A0ABT8J0Z2_9MICO|nr:TetR/AcrR family transcriptional regulator [Leifsonia virtsii]MDN4598740.1 TetR/AcrR family transcriptional regulator [Leifsonia virtsii]
MTSDAQTEAPRTRAQPMAADDRKAMIVDAVIPLLLEHGRGMTSRQIAEAAGIAEGTIFRAFGDKESLVQAAIEKYLDPEPLREALRSIDPALPLENKVRAILYLLRERFQKVMRLMPVIGPQRPPVPQERGEFARIIARVLEPETRELNWPPERVAHLLRLITFSSAFPALNEGIEFSIDDLARMVLVGIAGTSPHVTFPITPTEASCS